MHPTCVRYRVGPFFTAIMIENGDFLSGRPSFYAVPDNSPDYQARPPNKSKKAASDETALKFMFFKLLPSLDDRQVKNDRNDSEQNAANYCPSLELLFQCSALSLAVV